MTLRLGDCAVLSDMRIETWNDVPRNTKLAVMGTYLFSGLAFAGSFALLLIDKPLHHPFAGGALHLTALNLFFTGVVACSLLLGTSSLSFLANHPVLRFFGDISYGRYLVHMLVFNVYDGVQLRFFPDVPIFKGHFALMLLRFFICTLWPSRWQLFRGGDLRSAFCA
jgi:peptidoglycan/LPS O-acetylase OafA/YrhL